MWYNFSRVRIQSQKSEIHLAKLSAVRYHPQGRINGMKILSLVSLALVIELEISNCNCMVCGQVSTRAATSVYFSGLS